MPSPSSAPPAATETEETRKPALMMRSASAPARMLSGFWVNSPISWAGMARQRTVPAAMMAAHSPRVTR